MYWMKLTDRGLTLVGGVCFLIGSDLASQAKVEFIHFGCGRGCRPPWMRIFSNGIDLFLYGHFLDGVTPCGKNSVTDALVEDLEENDVVIHAFEVGNDIKTTEEMLPLLPHGGVLLEDGR